MGGPTLIPRRSSSSISSKISHIHSVGATATKHVGNAGGSSLRRRVSISHAHRGRERNGNISNAQYAFLLLQVVSLLGLAASAFSIINMLTNGSSRSDALADVRLLRHSSPLEPTQLLETKRNLRFSKHTESPCLFEVDHRLPEIDRYMERDFGELHIKELHDYSAGRVIDPHDYDAAEAHREQVLQAADEIYVSSKWWSYEDMDYYPGKCVRPKWSMVPKPNCNLIHETAQVQQAASIPYDPLVTFDAHYLAHGYYRDSYMLTSTTNTNTERIVLKQVRFDKDKVANAGMQHKILPEAVVLEALSDSPLTSNIYGHCSTSLLVEAANELTYDIVPFDPALQDERGRQLQDRLDLIEEAFGGGAHPFNKFTTFEKLDIALQFAESLAEMHGYKDGVIVNDDVHLDQWVITDDGRVILNDANNALFLEWNYEEQRYCPMWVSYGGDYRAPEEYQEDGAWVDETADIWPMGNLIHSLLTGLWPYYDMKDEAEIQQVTMEGQPPFLHPDFRTRSFIEQRMTEIMDRCHVLEPTERVDIFTVVDHLRETKQLYEHGHEKKKE